MLNQDLKHLYSCETALTNIMNKWTKAIDEDLTNGVILLDLGKVFDVIDHPNTVT